LKRSAGGNGDTRQERGEHGQIQHHVLGDQHHDRSEQYHHGRCGQHRSGNGATARCLIGGGRPSDQQRPEEQAERKVAHHGHDQCRQKQDKQHEGERRPASLRTARPDPPGRPRTHSVAPDPKR